MCIEFTCNLAEELLREELLSRHAVRTLVIGLALVTSLHACFRDGLVVVVGQSIQGIYYVDSALVLAQFSEEFAYVVIQFLDRVGTYGILGKDVHAPHAHAVEAETTLGIVIDPLELVLVLAVSGGYQLTGEEGLSCTSLTVEVDYLAARETHAHATADEQIHEGASSAVVCVCLGSLSLGTGCLELAHYIHACSFK